MQKSQLNKSEDDTGEVSKGKDENAEDRLKKLVQDGKPSELAEELKRRAGLA